VEKIKNLESGHRGPPDNTISTSAIISGSQVATTHGWRSYEVSGKRLFSIIFLHYFSPLRTTPQPTIIKSMLFQPKHCVSDARLASFLNDVLIEA
jgi:hypothetical protein